MARADRLFRLLQAMRVMAAPIAQRAARCGYGHVSALPLPRHRQSPGCGAQIARERGYGYRLIEDFSLPPQTFDRTEIEALAQGLAEVKHVGNPALTKAAISVIAKDRRNIAR